MRRLPFDPNRAHGGKADTGPTLPGFAGQAGAGASIPGAPQTSRRKTHDTLTVSQASELIKTALEQSLPSPLRVVGQVSNFNAKNHWYFSLKDESAVLHCVAWATAARKIGFTPKDGDEVVATGHVSHFGPQGRTQLYVSQLQPVGAGALEIRFRALCDELRGLGYFDEARKKPLPIFPRRVAVITSATGAAIQDVITTAAQRCKAIGLLLVDVRVQGEGAAAEIARAIRWVDANRVRLGVDGILVTRGGGSIEDLWAFNERIVADAVFKCSLPVVAAIGHESDTTIIELVADVRASTPTQAAMRLIPSSQELGAQIEHMAHRLRTMVVRTADRERHRAQRLGGDLHRIMALRFADEHARLGRLVEQLNQLQPGVQLAQRQARLTILGEALHQSMRRRMDERPRVKRLEIALRAAATGHLRRQRDRLAGLERHLVALNPEGVLRRGYSITALRDGTLVRSVRQFRAGGAIVTRVADGSFESIMSGTNAGTHGRSPAGKRPPSTPADDLDLFNMPR